MAEKKVCVYVDKFSTANAFDVPVGSNTANAMRRAAVSELEKAGYSTKASSRDEGFYLDGGLSKLEQKEEGGKSLLVAEVRLQLATWPKKSMFGFPVASGKLPTSKSGNVEGDVEQLAEELVRMVVEKQVTKAIKSRSK